MIENILAKYEGKALLTSKIGQYTEGGKSIQTCVKY